MTTTEVKVKYEPEIITRTTTFTNAVPLEQIPVFSIENCEVLNSSLGVPTPKFGHNIQIMLPADNTLQAVDRQIRNNYLVEVQKDNPNIEFIKGSLNIVSKADVLNGKFDEKLLNRAFINFNISSACMLDEYVDEEGTTKYKKINNAKEAKGTPVVKYFRAIDQFTGEGIDPEIFKYDNEANKVTTFYNKKTKQEMPIYLSKGDIVNIKLRPYGVKNQKTDELSLRYNILSIEQVQTAWDRGIGRTGGGSGSVKDAPDSVNINSLSSIFGGISTVAPATTPIQVATPKAEPVAQKVEAPKTEVKTEAKVEVKPEPVVEQPQTSEVPTLDFSALANLGAGLNLGE